MLFVCLLILFLFWYFFLKKKAPPLGENEYSFYFNPRNPAISFNQIKIGDSYSLWLKPESHLIYIYYPGYYFGEGYIGRFKSEKLYNQISSGEFGYQHKVTRIINNRVYITIELQKIDYEAIRLFELNSVNNFKEKISKKYTPIKSTTFLFTIIDLNKFPKKIIVRYVPLDDLLGQISYGEFYITMLKGVWLEDELGNLISNTNKTPYENLFKFFRAINSGYQPELKLISKVPTKLSRKFLDSVIEWEVIFNK